MPSVCLFVFLLLILQKNLHQFLHFVELAPSGFDVKSFPRQSRSRGGGIAIAYKSTLGSNITFKTNFDFTHTSFEVVQASNILLHNTHHFFCLYRPPPNRRNNLTDYVY